MNINCHIDGNFVYRLFFTLISLFKKIFYKVNFKKLSIQEQIILKKYFNNNLNEYTLDYITLEETDDTYPIILKLIKRNIISGYSDLEKIDHFDGNGVKYRLTSKAWKKLNKQLIKNKERKKDYE